MGRVAAQAMDDFLGASAKPRGAAGQMLETAQVRTGVAASFTTAFATYPAGTVHPTHPVTHGLTARVGQSRDGPS
jgi:hypothetical protein